MKSSGFIVVCTDGDSIFWPMGWDPDCKGALCCYADAIAVFPTKADAKHSIRISEAFYRLNMAKGDCATEDWSPKYRHCIKIIPLQEKP